MWNSGFEDLWICGLVDLWKISKKVGLKGPTVCSRRLQPSAGARKATRRAAIFLVFVFFVVVTYIFVVIC